ncbi:MAG: cytidylate kinase-like family protein [Planctomycetota bacterium]|nr:cytidylate kinase-like family protein [Planctomycetota bacterium]
MTDTKPEVVNQLGQVAKQHLERWLLSPALKQHMQAAGDMRKPKKTGPFIAISRQSGSDGTQIARLVGEKLGWDVLDKEILDFMTQRYDTSRSMLEFVDETNSSWVQDVLSSLADSRLISRDKFVAHLQRIICLAALHGRVILVGRGAHAILPREHGLAVRIIAPQELRVDHVSARRSLSRQEAAAAINETDKRRKEFCQRYFHFDNDDPLQYDLTINTARMAPAEAADVIIEAFRQVVEDPHRPAAA